MGALCQHTLLDLYECEPRLLKRARTVRAILCEAVAKAGGTIVKATFHNFNPYGVSGVVVITESHVTIHTWPEYGYAAVDVFSCSRKLDHTMIRRSLKKALSARSALGKSFGRGLPQRYGSSA